MWTRALGLIAPLLVLWHGSSAAADNGVSTALFADLERLARLVDISYCVGNTGIQQPFQCLSRCPDFPNLTLTTTWSTGILMGDSCGYVAVDDENEAIIVAFRGTYSIANTIVDLSTSHQKYVPYPGPDDDDKDKDRSRVASSRVPRCDNCTVHQGFLNSWENTRQVVIPELRALKAAHPSYKVHLVGHSLGGAMACLAALEVRLSLHWADDLTVTTFGQPRVGNQELTEFIDKVFQLDADDGASESLPYRRVTHSNDPVPLLPLEEWGYRQHSGEIFIAKQSLSPSERDLHLCNGSSDPACSTGLEEESLLKRVNRLVHFGSAQSDMSTEEFVSVRTLPTRLKLWELFFAHRDYFWRLGLCVPGGDPANWGRELPLPDLDSPDAEEVEL